MQDNFFFREPSTQKRLLDILFIYAKLNPDIGYRQGMHELLAPILWVVQQDTVDLTAVITVGKKAAGTDFMVDVLDQKFVEHDAFNLFCAVMQTAKAFYEVGDNRDASPIITRSKRIHDELLNDVDPELALHLTVIGILPQIYSM
jgi:TBC1 domain family member 5